jgi:hypothetical protein
MKVVDFDCEIEDPEDWEEGLIATANVIFDDDCSIGVNIVYHNGWFYTGDLFCLNEESEENDPEGHGKAAAKYFWDYLRAHGYKNFMHENPTTWFVEPYNILTWFEEKEKERLSRCN